MLSKRNRKLATVVLVAFIGVGLWGATAHIIPFKPFNLHGYTAIPPEGCPAILLEKLVAHYDLLEPAHVDVGPYVLKTNWERVGVMGSTDFQEFKGSFRGSKRGRDLAVRTPNLRTAPPDTGEWRIYSEFVIKGAVLLWPREQLVTFRSEKVYHAVQPGTESCPTL